MFLGEGSRNKMEHSLYCTVFQASELFEITQDCDWTDPSWAAKEESIPALLKELTVSSVLCSDNIRVHSNPREKYK